jgi:hypothetical protein
MAFAQEAGSVDVYGGRFEPELGRGIDVNRFTSSSLIVSRKPRQCSY